MKFCFLSKAKIRGLAVARCQPPLAASSQRTSPYPQTATPALTSSSPAAPPAPMAAPDSARQVPAARPAAAPPPLYPPPGRAAPPPPLRGCGSAGEQRDNPKACAPRAPCPPAGPATTTECAGTCPGAAPCTYEEQAEPVLGNGLIRVFPRKAHVFLLPDHQQEGQRTEGEFFQNRTNWLHNWVF